MKNVFAPFNLVVTADRWVFMHPESLIQFSRVLPNGFSQALRSQGLKTTSSRPPIAEKCLKLAVNKGSPWLIAVAAIKASATCTLCDRAYCWRSSSTPSLGCHQIHFIVVTPRNLADATCGACNRLASCFLNCARIEPSSLCHSLRAPTSNSSS